MTVGTVCNREVVVVEGDTGISETAKLMREYHVGNVVVIEVRKGLRCPIGILTDRDIVIQLIAKGIDINSVTIDDIMSTNLFIAKENDDVIDTIKLMRQKGIRRMPVVDENGGLVGIITLDDLIDLFAEQLRDLADLISREQQSEMKMRE